MWSLCNKAESASAIKSSCGATSGFKSGDLSTSGTWLLKALNGSLPAGHDASRDATPSTQTQPSSSGQKPKPVTFTTGGLTCKATLTSSWSAGNGKTCYQYDLSITNKGNARSSWTVTVPFNKAISYTNGWNGSYKANGSTLTIRNASYNGTLAKGATITGIGFQVTASSGLSVKGSS
jgi:endoglucanase